MRPESGDAGTSPACGTRPEPDHAYQVLPLSGLVKLSVRQGWPSMGSCAWTGINEKA